MEKPKFVLIKSDKRSYSAVSYLLYVKDKHRILAACWDKQVKVYDEELNCLNHIELLGWANHVMRLSDDVFIAGGFETSIVSFTLLESEPHIKELKRIATSENKQTFVRLTDDLFLTTSRDKIHVFSYSKEQIVRTFSRYIKADYTVIPVVSKKFDSCFYTNTTREERCILLINYQKQEDEPVRSFKPFDRTARILSFTTFLNFKGDEIIVTGGGHACYFFDTSIIPKDEKLENNTAPCIKKIELPEMNSDNIWRVSSMDISKTWRTTSNRSPNYIFLGDVAGYIHLLDVKKKDPQQYSYLCHKNVGNQQYVRDIQTISYTPNSIRFVCGLGNGTVKIFNIENIEVNMTDNDMHGLTNQDLRERILYLREDYESTFLVNQVGQPIEISPKILLFL